MKVLETGLELLAKNDPASICRGAEFLAQSGQVQAIEALLPLLRSRSETAKDCVRRALDSMDVGPLLSAWWDGPDAEKRARALTYASALAHPGLMKLYREAVYDKETELRKRTAIGLKRQEPTAEVLELLTVLAADSEKEVRWWTIDALGTLDVPEARAILDKRLATEMDADLKPFIERALRPT